MNPLTLKLYQAWADAVAAGEVANQFVAPQNDSAGRWRAGDRVIYGLRPDDSGFAFYAENLDQAQPIYGAVEERTIGDSGYICQYNGYRALRPGLKRSPPGRQPPLSAEVADCRFFCTDPQQPLSLLRRRPLMQIRLPHYRWQAYYNAAPIEKAGHFLWLPVDPANPAVLPHLPQVLTLAFLHDAIALFRQLDRTIVFFNGLGAGASVNHIHIQSAFHAHPVAIQQAPLKPLPGVTVLADYLTPGLVFAADASASEVFGWVQRLQHQGIPHSLVMVGDRIVLFPRDINHEVVTEFPTDRPGAPAFWGKLLTADHATFKRVTPEQLRRAFSKMGLNSDQFASLVSGP